MAFILDTNIFLQAKNFNYPMRYFPGFWDWLDLGFKSGQLILHSSVYKEVIAGNDEASDWIRGRSQYVINKNTNELLGNHKKIANFVKEKGFKYIDGFLAKADSRIIAYAMCTHDTIITLEKSEPSAKKNPKIPDVCLQFNVKCKNLLYLFENSNPNPVFTLKQY